MRLKQSILVFALFCSGAMSAVAETVELETPQGKLLGERVGTNKSVSTFKAIPYALPPVGDYRWKPAQPAPAWQGVRLATDFSPNCAQAPYPEGSFFARENPPTSEDCLYLNVWTPAKLDEKLPVMVWIHGGALTRGSGATETYDGTALAEKGVVLVSINYRLNIFGYFAHPELIAESPNKAAGNYGTTDQIQALKWVQENVSAFGGDPNKVTIFGESAGSWSVNHLVATPLAKGLFHRAIGQSGAVMGPMTELHRTDHSESSAEARGENWAKKAGAKSLAELRAMPAHELLAAFERNPHPSEAVVDGWVIPEPIHKIFAEGKQNPVQSILGFNSDEGTTLGALARVPENAAVYEKAIRARYGVLADEYLKLYPASDLKKSTLDSFRDGFVAWSMQTWANHMANVDQPVWFYYFTHRPSGPQQEQLGAYHAAEIRYAFNNYKGPINYEQKMAEIMSDYWVSFAKTGNPNSANAKQNQRPEWEAYTATDRDYMEFNAESKAGAVPDKNVLEGVWEFYEKLYDAQD